LVGERGEEGFYLETTKKKKKKKKKKKHARGKVKGMPSQENQHGVGETSKKRLCFKEKRGERAQKGGPWGDYTMDVCLCMYTCGRGKKTTRLGGGESKLPRYGHTRGK